MSDYFDANNEELLNDFFAEAEQQAAKITATSGSTDGSDKKRPVKKGEKVGSNAFKISPKPPI